jgi:transposase-like protein
MKKTRHTPNQIIAKLRLVEAALAEGRTAQDAVRDIGVSEQTYYRWKREYGQMDRDQLKRLKELEKENRRLKKLVADLSLDKDILKEALEGKGLSHEIVCQARLGSVLPSATSKRRWT